MAKLDHQEATRIYSELLDQIGRCYAENDFDTFSDLIHLPHHINTQNERFAVRTPEQLRQFFDAACTLLVTAEGASLNRKTITAKFKGHDRINGSHETNFPTGSENGRPYVSHTVLMWIGLKWRMAASDYVVEDDTYISKLFREAFAR